MSELLSTGTTIKLVTRIVGGRLSVDFIPYEMFSAFSWRSEKVADGFVVDFKEACF